MSQKRKNKIVQKRRTYKVLTINQKKAIVQEIEEQQLSVTEAMEKFNIHSGNTIRSWITEYGSGIPYKLRVRHTKEVKLQVVSEISAGLSYMEVSKKYGVHLSTVKNWCNVYSTNYVGMNKQEVKPEKTDQDKGNSNAFSDELEYAKLKIVGLETMIKLAEEEFNIDIRKKFGTKQ